LKKILVPVDGSETSTKAAVIAIDLARKYGSEVTMITVAADVFSPAKYPHGLASGNTGLSLKYKQIYEDLFENSKKILDSVESQLNASDLTISKKVLTGTAHEEIVNFAKEGSFDLIVMGRRGTSKFNRFMVGSETQRVLAEASCSVYVVKE
jgi:nucleotide-binding universal stress UspA family protein